MQQHLEQQWKEHKAEMELQREQLDAVFQQRETQHQADLQQRDQQHKAELDTLLSLAAKKSTEGMSTPSFAPLTPLLNFGKITGPDSVHLLLPTPSLMNERHRYF